ncbi:hypothetical protein [Fortiea contorta]|nr:hypothetical protein [Fortiea contorta]
MREYAQKVLAGKLGDRILPDAFFFSQIYLMHASLEERELTLFVTIALIT